MSSKMYRVIVEDEKGVSKMVKDGFTEWETATLYAQAVTMIGRKSYNVQTYWGVKA